MRDIIRIATRKSPLALWQAHFIKDQLLTFWPDLTIELLPLTTSGDRFLNDKLLSIGGKGLFVKELEEALLDKRADLAVHSMKDVPVSFPVGLTLPIICARHNPFDVLVSRSGLTFNELADDAVIGTSSLRRQSQILALKPNLKIKPIRGNLHTRLKKMNEEGYDALILAAAGLERLEMQDLISERFSQAQLLPACGQGALGIECRENDSHILTLLNPLHDETTALCVRIERRVNALLGGNCHTPLSVYCELVESQRLSLQAKVASEDGKMVISAQHESGIEDEILLAEQTVQRLLDKGAQLLLDRFH